MVGATSLRWLLEVIASFRYSPFALTHGNISINHHDIRCWYNPIQYGISQSTSSQSIMPALRDELRADNGRGLSASVLHQFQQIPLFGIGSWNQKELVQDHKGIFLILFHKLLVFSLNPCSFKFTE